VKQVLLAQAEAEKIRKIGEAEAAVIEAMGKAEAERMKLKAEAYQKYGDAAKMALVLEALPQVRLPPKFKSPLASARTSLGLVINSHRSESLSEEHTQQGPSNRPKPSLGPMDLNLHTFQIKATQTALGLNDLEKEGRGAVQDKWMESGC
jgi:hypothetical protein